MKRNRKGFTLIELIIVVSIVGILALVAIPKYFANIEKARKAEAVSTCRAIREGLLGYYSANNAYPAADTFPITVVVDGETVLSLQRPLSANFTYSYTAANVVATRVTGSYTYTMSIETGNVTSA